MTPKARNQPTVISKLPKPREGWEEVFRNMAKRDDDKLLEAQTALLTLWTRMSGSGK